MSDAKQCDGCGEYGSGIGWLQLERLTIQSMQEPSEWHFDTWTCLRDFAQRAGEKRDD